MVEVVRCPEGQHFDKKQGICVPDVGAVRPGQVPSGSARKRRIQREKIEDRRKADAEEAEKARKEREVRSALARQKPTFTVGSKVGGTQVTKEQFEQIKGRLQGSAAVSPLADPVVAAAVARQRALLSPEQQREQARKEEELEELAPIAEQVGEFPFTPVPAEKDILSIEQAIKSALATTLPGVAAGAVAGGAGGALVGGVGAIPGAIGGAALGGTAGFVAGFRGNLKVQRADILKGSKQNLMRHEQNMLRIVMEVNKGGDPMVLKRMFNDQLSLIDLNYEKLQLETDDELSKWLAEDGHTQLERYENFNSEGGSREFLIGAMRDAIVNPRPDRNTFLLERFPVD